jgi:hypothetical protein
MIAVWGLWRSLSPRVPICSFKDHSIPTTPTKSPMFPRVSGGVIPESINRYYLAREVLIQAVVSLHRLQNGPPTSMNSRLSSKGSL